MDHVADRAALERRVGFARRRVKLEWPPFSPAWDAAMAELEHAERELRRADDAEGRSTGEAHRATTLTHARAVAS
jgi:hypothetical protein